RLCHRAKVPVVPWGGKTGLVDGAFADNVIALSLERMNKVIDVDVTGATVTVEAGCPLQALCERVEQDGLFFPLDLGARGSATIGGNISTNAGGNRVLRFGMMRDMVLGLEVVLADGTILSSLNHLIKNNAGYDLKQLFVGSEGTLGVVTRAVLRLRALPASQNVAIAAVRQFSDLPRLLRRLETDLSGTLSAFEVMWEEFYRLVTTAPAKGHAPVPHGYPYYVLVESLGGDAAVDDERFRRALEEAFEDGEIVDAVVAKSQDERNRMWALRDDVGQVARFAPIFTFDVSLPIRHMETYIAKIGSDVHSQWPQARIFVFGHMGDGNLHVLLSVGDQSPQTRHKVELTIYQPLAACGGSISAEHGIGLQKRDYLPLSRSSEEISLMGRIKKMLDPENILNPGKIIEL
ncbi:MAG: FAD-binding oxidoreductase, partial [Alphaproteobacteria bacterium]|nr:FAD-binding oxidoreductase [Alphaproteobacteria bacterium]